MKEGLLAAKNTASVLPYITASDIETCVAANRLDVEHNIDEEAVAETDRLVDEHIARVSALCDGISRTVIHTVEQDAQWAMSFGPAGW